MVGMSACVPFLPLYIRDLGVADPQAQKLWSGLIFAGPFTLSIIVTPFWGMIGDKYGRKPMLIRAIFGLAIAMLLMGFARTVEQLLFFRILQGVLSGFMAAVLGFIVANTPSEKSGYAIGLFQSSVAAGNIIGPLIGGVISDFSGIRSVFYLVAILCAISGFLVMILVVEKNKGSLQEKKHTLKSNLKFIIKSKYLSSLIGILMIVQIGFYITNPVFAYFIEHLHAPAKYLSTITGTMVGIVGVFYVIFSPRWGKANDKADFRKILFYAILISGILQLLHSIMPEYYYIYPLRVGLGIISSAVIPTLYSSLNKQIPEENKGGIMGFASSANIFGTLIGYLMSSAIAPFVEINLIFVISGVILVFSAILVKILFGSK
jgi:DHA1 family multidrug resistance protein-like MFS transporter